MAQQPDTNNMGKKQAADMEASERLARVEAGQETTQRDVGDIKKDLREMKEGIRHDLEGVRASIERLADRPVCPQPGLCVSQKALLDGHDKELADLRGRVRLIEDDANRAKGGGAAVKLLWGALWTVVGAGTALAAVWMAK